MSSLYRFGAIRFLVLLCAMLSAAPAAAQVDFSGEWAEMITEDSYERSGGPPLGDYQGIPLNDAGRMKADSHDHSEWSLPEFQCRPHPGPYQWRALGGVRFTKDINPVSRELAAIRIEYLRSLERVIYMDGRPHPPVWAPHSWSGFSTGEFHGHMLVVTTTHLKGSYLRRNGASFSDKATMMEYITRHGDYLMVVMIVTDPVWLEEPFIQTTTYRWAPNQQLTYYPCTVSEENISNQVPHFLPGETAHLQDAADWIPLEGARGGAATTYPEFQGLLSAGVPMAVSASPRTGEAPVRPVPDSFGTASAEPPAVGILPIQGNIYMLAGGGGNVTASIGPDGVLLVDTGLPEMSEKILEAIVHLQTQATAAPAPMRCMGLHCPGTPYGWVSPTINAMISSPAPPKPIRYIINTSVSPERIGGNEKLSELPENTRIVGVTFPPISVAPSAIMIAHENVLARMSETVGDTTAVSVWAWPTDTYRTRLYKLSQFFNGEGVQVFHVPNAHTDGDSIVHFRFSDVIAAGGLVSTESYPVIDLEKGGGIQGIVEGLNLILELAIPEFRSQGGTMIVPGQGRLMDAGDMANYRNMVVIIRDRIQALIDRGMSLEEVQAARPTFDYDGLYGSETGPWTTAMFVEAVYRSLSGERQ